MDQRTKNFRQKLNNYHSLAELPKPFTLTTHYDSPLSPQQPPDSTYATFRMLDYTPKNKENRNSYETATNNRIELIENRVATL